MTYKTILAGAILAAGTSTAIAQGFTGGNLGMEYNTYPDVDNGSSITYFGGVEFGINRDFGIGIDVSGYNPEDVDESISSSTIHGIYHLNGTTSLGIFYGQDVIEDSSVDLYGIEGGTEFAGGSVEGFLGTVDGDGSTDVTIYGLSSEYAVATGFSVVGGLEGASFDGEDVSALNIEIGGQYEMPNGPKFFAALGNSSIDFDGGSDDENYITVGASISFGAARGTTFGRRSLFEVSPGY